MFSATSDRTAVLSVGAEWADGILVSLSSGRTGDCGLPIAAEGRSAEDGWDGWWGFVSVGDERCCGDEQLFAGVDEEGMSIDAVLDGWGGVGVRGRLVFVSGGEEQCCGDGEVFLGVDKGGALGGVDKGM